MIPKPYYEDAHVTLYCGDCREILPQLGTFDLLLTDPPYGHGDKWQGGTWGAAEMYKDAMKWDAETPSEETIADVLKAATVGIVWGGNYFRLPPSRCWLSWEKSSRMDTLADFELAWTSMDRPCKAKREDRNPDGKRCHPTQKPLSILRWCFGFVADAKTIIDPFAGSCTTGVAAKLEGRHATLIEISERYCEIGAERLRQGVLF